MNTSGFPADELFNLELRIARRADEIARRLEKGPSHPLEPWKQAENEIWSTTAQPQADAKVSFGESNRTR